MRLHELAKELSADSKRLLEIAKELGLGVKSHSSNMEKGTEGIMRAAWAEELAEIAEKEAKKAAKRKRLADEEAAAAAAAAPPAPEPEVIAEPVVEVVHVASGAEAEERERAPEPTVVHHAPVEPQHDPVVAGVADDAALATAALAPSLTDDPNAHKKLVVTIGGHVALPANADEQRAAEGGPAGAPGDETKPATGDEPAPGSVETTGPTRRRGARILGRIELKPKDLPARHRPVTPGGGGGQQPNFDPLDPTRPATPRRGIALGPTPRKTGATETDAGKAGKGAKTKPGGFEWVFDPEDNSALAAIRIGHFAGQRRPTTRRPPVRRSSLGSARKRRGAIDRPTHGIEVRPPIGVRELSEELGVKAREILMHFPGTFDPRDKNAIINEEQLIELALKMKREITVLPPETDEDRLLAYEDARAIEMATESLPRPPVVAVMGHVDHGKTSLLDALRKTQVASGEAGGITQRSAAYLVRTPSGAAVTFLDTPGHKAFTEMRARGARLTDVAVLVVAADDGVMEQTQEAIDHAKAADAPLVVAINKMDKPGADPRMVRQQLATAGVMVEDWGGEIGVVECSATTGKGLNELVERLALETEILELRADPAIPARGVVVDSRKDNKLGIVVTAVVMDGTLRAKDAVLAGTAVGRVRYMLDDRGARIDEAGPSVPVQILGFEDVPESGSDLLVVEDINQARGVAKLRQQNIRQEALMPAAVDTVTLENLFSTIEAQKVTELNVMVKADAQGTLDVLKRTIEELKHPEVRFKVIRGAVGGITEDDVLLASASKSLIIGFAVTADANARAALARTGVEVKHYDVIYEMADDLEKALEGELAPEKREQITGHVNIREVFKISRYGSIAGCYVTDGIITRDSRIRLTRDGKVIWTGKLDSLKRFKDDVKEVRENYECGLHLANYDDIRQGDILETFDVTEVRRTLSSPAIKA